MYFALIYHAHCIPRHYITAIMLFIATVKNLNYSNQWQPRVDTLLRKCVLINRSELLSVIVFNCRRTLSLAQFLIKNKVIHNFLDFGNA